MRRVMLVASWVVLALVAPSSEARGSTPVAECVQVEPEAVASGMSLKVHNTCEFAVRCELSWSVRCDGDAEDAAPRSKNIVVRLAAAAREVLLASGEACGARIWEITDDRWECTQVR